MDVFENRGIRLILKVHFLEDLQFLSDPGHPGPWKILDIQ